MQPNLFQAAKPEGPLNVFLGLQPPAPVATEAERTARRLIRSNDLRCYARPPRVLHVSLHGLANCRWRAPIFEFAAIRAVQELTTTAFDIRFDAAASLNAQSRFEDGRFPVALLTDSVSRTAYIDLWLMLGQALGRSVDGSAKHVLPHMTVAYSQGRIGEQPIKPLGWRVEEVVLVRSFVGETRHLVIHRQPLRPPN